MFKKQKTCRGFKVYSFHDTYNKTCSLQESSAVEPHVWLGVDDPEHLIHYCDSQKLGLNLEIIYPESNEFGWCNYPIPKEVIVSSRMHLNRQQAKKLGEELIKFAKKGYLE